MTCRYQWKFILGILMSAYARQMREFFDKVGRFYFDELYAKGILADSLSGLFFETSEKKVLEIVRQNPDWHILTSMHDRYIYNYFITDGKAYFIGNGDKNPELKLHWRSATPEEFGETLKETLEYWKAANIEPDPLFVAIYSNLAMGLTGVEGVIEKKTFPKQ